ncbi:MAG: hypothetical protein CME62_13310 [Halobacteriovoraceae bacterium]|nr:hypothetical protein [Halobacteriovoraceae bacterium]|tara:strand:+ start:7718 stop:8707 length:990 start_codon:yes stop_codon:yes gene_type:complete
MKKLLLLCLGVMSLSAFADSPDRFCRYEFTWDDDQRECRQILRQGRRVNQKAMDLCAEEAFSDAKLQCLREIVHARFEHDALNFCATEMRFSSDKPDCVKVIRNGIYDRDGLNVCRSLTFDKLDCLEAIKNKRYPYGEATRCLREITDSSTVRCLERSGRYTNRGPRGRRGRNKVVVTTTTTAPVVYDHEEYVACYERPKTRLIEYTDTRKAKRGRNKVIGGLAAILGGAIIGGDAGNVVAAAGVGLTAWGAIEVADSSEIIYVDNGYDCRSYYTVDTRRYTKRIEGRQCTTTRYYTTRWGQTHEYFETTCSGRRYMTFERNADIWYMD